MSRETEKIFREFHNFIEGKDLNEEELEKAFDEFINIKNSLEDSDKEDSWYYLDKAYESYYEEDALKYARKALEKDKNCLDAEILIAELTNDDIEELKIEYEELIKKAEKQLSEEDIFDKESIGRFWGILETRPYMRLRNSYLQILISMGKFKKAINQCEDLLRLSENDNMGIRYTLMSLYALFEDEKNMLKLYKKYTEETTGMLLPMVALYYKKDNYKEARKYLKLLNKVNNDMEDFFYNLDEYNEAEVEEIADSGMYRPNSIEEIIITISENKYLYVMAPTLFIWVAENLSKL